MRFHMIYPVDRWITDKQLMDGAADAIVNNGLTAEDGEFTIPPVTVNDAIEILEWLGDITLTNEPDEPMERE